jgi:hypothetical protein
VENDSKWSKVGCLFPLHFFILGSIPSSCSMIVNNNNVWHKKLGHLNSIILTYLMKHGYLGNKNFLSYSTMSFDYGSCKLGKNNS